MSAVDTLPIYDPGNAPEIHGIHVDIEVVGQEVIFCFSVPRTVGGERVRYVTGYLWMAKEAIAGNIAKTELALLAEDGMRFAS